MRRRRFIALAGGTVLGWPVVSRAQQSKKIAQLGFLGASFASSWADRIEAFRSGLRELGYVEDKNIHIEFRWANEQYDQLSALAAELVRLNVDVLLTYGTPGTLAAKRATTDVPVVFLYSGDAVATGLVSSLNHPGGNITGSTYFLPQLMAKRLELLKEAVPRVARVAFFVNPDNPLFKSTLPVLQTAANSLNVELVQFNVSGPSDFEAAFIGIDQEKVDALVIQEDAVLLGNLRTIAAMAAKRSLPFVSSSEFAESGGLIGYGIDFLQMCRHAATFVHKILQGSKPADIPVEQATKFETILNLSAAKTLGITIPTSILLRADHVIE
jgi:ABC-type uncharacterized transport system substrate-binding protein